jgi:hypothetical protein
MNNQRVVQTNALPPNVVKPFPGGANNIFSAGIIAQQNNNLLQSNLTKQNGGIKHRKLKTRKRIKRRKLKTRKRIKRRKLKGGANPPVVVVPGAQSYAPNASATNSINAQIAGLAISTNNNAVYDKTGSQGDVNAISTAQNRVYYGAKGGAR